ncbi:MAG: hypothetical protein ACW98X_22215 [Promethearchaeota archaeon]|jgi:hypothetical protein
MKTLLFVLSICAITTINRDITTHNHIEPINTLEDMIEWMQWDIEQGAVDSIVGVLYIENMERTIQQLR